VAEHEHERERERWHAPTGLSGLTEPARLWWWLLLEHTRELSWLLSDLPLTPDQRRQVLRLQQVHTGELAALAGHPTCPVPVRGKVPSTGGSTPDEPDEPTTPHPG
jgi:hypothetical protein